jgi:hypothetical protein
MIPSAAIVLLLAFSPAFIAPNRAQTATKVEHVTQKPEQGLEFTTKRYEPSDKERPFYEKLGADELATGGLAGDYRLHAKRGKYVGWFGIVREVAEDKAKSRTVLTVEHKYFDGVTDAHIQAVSFNGDGDFQVVVRGTGHRIEPLSLVKVYGTVASADQTGRSFVGPFPTSHPPRLDADFIRDWHWGAFTFIGTLGDQHGSEKWRKLNAVDPKQIYDPYPDDHYFELRLGKKPAKTKRKAKNAE